MIQIYYADTDEYIGEITEDQLQYLIDQLEEESLADQDYAISSLLLAEFEAEEADQELIELLRGALDANEEVLIRWDRNPRPD